MTLNELNTLVAGLWAKVKSYAGKRVVAYPSVTSDWLFQDAGYVPSQAELNDILVNYLPNWQEDNAVVSVINALLASTDITGVTMGLESFRALSTATVEYGTWGYNSMAPGNVVTNATLGTNTYLIYGTTDTVAPQLPMVQSTVPGYTGTISGTFDDTDAALEHFKGYDNNAYDIQVVAELLCDLEAAGGATISYTMTRNAFNALNVVIADIDTMGERVPNIESSAATQVTIYVPDYDAADEFVFSFTCASDNCVLTLPAGVAMADGFDFSADRKAGAKFQISIQDGIAGYLIVSTN